MNSSIIPILHVNVTEQIQQKCFSVHNVPPDVQCNFVENTLDCTAGEAFVSYIRLLYCSFGPNHQSLGLFIYFFLLLMLFISLGTTADNMFCPALTVIAKVLHLSENLAGVTILAFGNGSPDIFTALAGAPSGRTELVYGELFGSGLFVTTVIAGTICICCPFKVMDHPFLRDSIFYLGAAFWAFYIFFKGEISLFESIGFILLYLVYITVVLGGRACKGWSSDGNETLQRLIVDDNKRASVDSVGNSHHSKSSVCVDLALHAEQISQLASFCKSQEIENLRNEISKLKSPVDNASTPLLGINRINNNESFWNLLKEVVEVLNPMDRETWYDSMWYSRIIFLVKIPIIFLLKLLIPVVNYTSEKDGWCKLLNVFHCISTPLFCAFATRCFHLNLLPNIEGITFPFWVLLLLLCLGISIAVYFTSTKDQPPRYHSAFAFLGFIGSIILIYLIANEIINLLRSVGIVFVINETLLGLTVLAWGNSIGDFVTDLTIARQGYERMGFSACFGGPLFNALLGIGISFTVASVENDGYPIKLTYGGPGPLLTTFIFISLASSLIALPAMGFKANRFYGYYLIFLYSLFVILTILYQFGCIVIPTILHDPDG